MPNWLVNAEQCLREEGACVILKGRDEVLSRSTRVYRAVEGEGTKTERTVWSSGNVSVTRKGGDARIDQGPANLRLTVTQIRENASHADTSPPLLPAEAVLASDVLRAAAVNAGGSACGGETLLEVIWSELDAVMDRLMTGQAVEEDKGVAQGVAYCIAVINNPYLPNIDDVRAQAMARWEEAQAKAEAALAAKPPSKLAARRAARARRSR